MKPDIIQRTLTDLLLREPFWGSLALSMEYVQDETIPTESTDGITIRYNPKFAASLSREQFKSEICHELNHCARLHMYRGKGFDSQLWNVATDYRINEDMAKDGYQLDSTWLRASWVGDMSEEQIYRKLLEMPKKEREKLIKQCQGHGQVKQTDGTEEQAKAKAQEWKQKVVQAVMVAKQDQGTVPASIAAMVDSLLNPAIDWRQTLRKWRDELAKNDFTWEIPDPCYCQQGVYLPSLKSEQMPAMVFYWDTSGSRWSDQHRQRTASEVIGILREAMPKILYLIYGDAIVQGVDEIGPNDPVKFNPIGGGGTDFRPIFDHIAKHELNPAVFIGMTDLQGNFPDKPPPYPVIWVTDVPGTAPFGEVLEVKP